jgi:hypothetical protein
MELKCVRHRSRTTATTYKTPQRRPIDRPRPTAPPLREMLRRSLATTALKARVHETMTEEQRLNRLAVQAAQPAWRKKLVYNKGTGIIIHGDQEPAPIFTQVFADLPANGSGKDTPLPVQTEGPPPLTHHSEPTGMPVLRPEPTPTPAGFVDLQEFNSPRPQTSMDFDPDQPSTSQRPNQPQYKRILPRPSGSQPSTTVPNYSRASATPTVFAQYTQGMDTVYVTPVNTPYLERPGTAFSATLNTPMNPWLIQPVATPTTTRGMVQQPITAPFPDLGSLDRDLNCWTVARIPQQPRDSAWIRQWMQQQGFQDQHGEPAMDVDQNFSDIPDL